MERGRVGIDSWGRGLDCDGRGCVGRLDRYTMDVGTDYGEVMWVDLTEERWCVYTHTHKQ